MVDIAAIGEMLASLRQALEIVKFLTEHRQEEYGTRLTDLGQLLGAVRGQLFEAQTMAEFETSLRPISTLVKFNDAYYEADESNHPTGEAYCMHCWETDVVKHHLHRWHENERVNICSHCQTKYLVGRTTFTYRGGL